MSISRVDRAVILVLLTLLLSSCAAERAPVPETAPVGAIVKDVGRVIVTTSPEIPPDVMERLEEVHGVSSLRQAVETKVERVGKVNPSSPRTLDVEIIRCRLRFTAVVFWAGIMSGVDYLDVKVTVHEGDRIVRQYETGAASLKGMRESTRWERMVDAVGERVAEQL
jgi:hypothetical protein